MVVVAVGRKGRAERGRARARERSAACSLVPRKERVDEGLVVDVAVLTEVSVVQQLLDLTQQCISSGPASKSKQVSK